MLIIFLLLDKNIYSIKENKESPMDSNKEFGVQVHAERQNFWGFWEGNTQIGTQQWIVMDTKIWYHHNSR